MHLRRSFETDTYPHLWSDAQRLQIVGELVGLLPQFPVSQLQVLVEHGNTVRTLVDLCLNQLVNKGTGSIVVCRVIPRNQDLVPFRGRENGQPAYEFVWIGRDAFQQCLVAFHHSGDGRIVV